MQQRFSKFLKEVKEVLKPDTDEQKLIKINTQILDNLVTALPKLLKSTENVVLKPYEFNLSKNISVWKKQNLNSVLIIKKILDHDLLKFKGVFTTNFKNFIEIFQIFIALPESIENDLKIKGHNPEDINNIINSELVKLLTLDIRIFKILEENSLILGNILWQFQNDIVRVLDDIINTPSQLTTLSKLRLAINVLNSQPQLEILINVIDANKNVFAKMLSDPQSAYYKLLMTLGIDDPKKIANLIPEIIDILKTLPSHHKTIKDIIIKVENIYTENQSIDVKSVIEIIGLATPILKDKNFIDAIKLLFKESNISNIEPIISAVISQLPLDNVQRKAIQSLIDDPEFAKFTVNTIETLADKIPKVLDLLDNNSELIYKIINLRSIENSLNDENLNVEEKKILAEQLHDNQLTSVDISKAISLGLNLLEELDLSSLLNNNRVLLAEMGNTPEIQELFKTFLPPNLDVSGPLLSQLISLLASTGSYISSPATISAISTTLPKNIIIILEQLGNKDEFKASNAQFFESINTIGLTFANLIKRPEFINIYRTQLLPLIKANRPFLNEYINNALQTNIEAKKFHIESESILKFLEDEKSLVLFSSAFTNIMEKNYARGIFDTLSALTIAGADSRKLVWHLIIDVVVNYYRENIVPSFVKRWMAGAAITQILSIDHKGEQLIDLSAHCQLHYKSHNSLPRYLIKTQNFSEQIINTDLNNLVIDQFNFTNVKSIGSEINLTGSSISKCKMNFNTENIDIVNLTNATIDISTLESMIEILSNPKVKVIFEGLKLFESPFSNKAFEVLNKINNSSLKSQLETVDFVSRTKKPEVTHSKSVISDNKTSQETKLTPSR